MEEVPQTPGFYNQLFVVPKVTGGLRHLPQPPCHHYKVLNGNGSDGAGSCPLAQLYGVGRVEGYVHPVCCQFLRFAWEGRALQFRALCFGLSTALQVFTRIMAPVLVELHKQGIRLL